MQDASIVLHDIEEPGPFRLRYVRYANVKSDNDRNGVHTNREYLVGAATANLPSCTSIPCFAHLLQYHGLG